VKLSAAIRAAGGLLRRGWARACERPRNAQPPCRRPALTTRPEASAAPIVQREADEEVRRGPQHRAHCVGHGEGEEGAAPSPGGRLGSPPAAVANTVPLPVKSAASPQRGPATGANSELTA